MTRLKEADVAGLDVRELEAVEYSTEQFDYYEGDVPPVDTILRGYVKRMWWTRSANNDAMLKILWIAAENEGDLKQYDGLPVWLNAALIASAKFRWDPFLQWAQISLAAIKARKVDVDKADQNGAPIKSIDGFHPGEDHDEAWGMILIGHEPYQGETKAIAKDWLEWEDELDDSGESDEDEYEDEDETGDEEGDEYEDEEEGEAEDEQPAEPPARGRRGSRSAPATAQTRGARTAGKAPAATATRSGARSARGSGSAPSGRTAAAPARGSRTASAPARGRGRRSADNEPPF